jgi:hypothetical protein
MGGDSCLGRLKGRRFRIGGVTRYEVKNLPSSEKNLGVTGPRRMGPLPPASGWMVPPGTHPRPPLDHPWAGGCEACFFNRRLCDRIQARGATDATASSCVKSRRARTALRPGRRRPA